MPKLNCRACSKALRVDASLAGKKVKCPHCGEVNAIPEATRDEAPPKPVVAAPAAKKPPVAKPPAKAPKATKPPTQAAKPPAKDRSRDGRSRSGNTLGGSGESRSLETPATLESDPDSSDDAKTSESTPAKEAPSTQGVIVDSGPRSPSATIRARRKRSAAPTLLFVVGGGGAVVGLVLVVALMLNSESTTEESSAGKPKPSVAANQGGPSAKAVAAKAPQVEPIDDVSISVDDVLLVSVEAASGDEPTSPLRYALGPGAPMGARIHPETGEISWSPNDSDVGKSRQFTVSVANADGNGANATVGFQVLVTPSSQPPTNTLADGRGSETPVMEEGDQSKPTKVAAVDSELPKTDLADKPPAKKTPTTPPKAKTTTTTLPQTAEGGFTEEEITRMRELYDTRSLFSSREYPALRRVFADRFERQREQEIKAAFGADYDSISTWLDENRVLKEELYTAIDPEVDDVQSALQIFKELKEKFADKIVQYGNLAVAIAVTWDNPKAIYDYAHHQRRAKSTMPDGLTGAAENFEYFLKTEQFMQGRGQWLPWEFLVHVVNHKTPMAEREWALKSYLPKRVMIGKCYAEVPYDQVMLETGSAQARMNDQVYTLANLSEFGGVCAHQADFASRVGKSLAVPAAYVGGESTYGDLHAWVMWVELKAVTSKSIVFSLQSHGRYRGDKYYVGTLKDPKSGQKTTDRQLELRLHTVGMDPVAKRQSDTVMAAYPVLKEKLDLGINDQFSYMSRTINLCPGNEEAWTALAGMASNEVVKEKHQKQMTGILTQLFNNFAAFPDFTWTIFDDLIAYEERLKERIKLYERLVLLYQMAQRPDLACEARLRLTDLLVEDKREIEAIDGLAATIYLFADEGRYVPRMLDRIEEICQDVEGATPHLLRFYASFLPKIPQMRGSRPSKYCMEMFERGIAKFQKHGQLAAAQAFQAQLTQIEAGRGRKN